MEHTEFAQQSTPLRDAALTYAEWGWRVIPLHCPLFDDQAVLCSCGNKAQAHQRSIGKHPHLEAWQDAATTDAAQICAWWTEWPTANVGLRTGAGLVVLDCDPRNGGDVALDDLTTRYEPLPETVQVLTGGGGQHYYFTHPQPLPSLKLAHGLDFQADGTALVVAPPSRHGSGTPYSWEASAEPDACPLAPLPAWVVTLVQERAALLTVAASALPAELPTVTLEGLQLTPRLQAVIRTGQNPKPGKPYPSRSEALFAVETALIKAGHDDGTIAAVLLNPAWAISEKPLAQKDQRSAQYLALTKGWVAKDIARARAKLAAESTREATPRDSPRMYQNGRPAPDAPDHATPRWQQKLKYTAKGDPQTTLGNYCEIFTYHPHWQERLTFDTLRYEPCLDHTPFEIFTATRAAHWLCTDLGMSVTQRTPVLQALVDVAHRTPVDPLAAHLAALPPWDRTPRLKTWLVTYFGAIDSLYTRWAGRAFLAGMLSRALHPGGIMRLCLILEGPEGNKKSAAVAILGGPFASAMSASLEGKESQMRLKGVWVMELPELDALSRSEETRIKAFLSLTDDAYVPKYESAPVTYPRRTVFIGTTNEREYLKGQHGNTRYLPMRTRAIDVAALARDRDQLLAEGLRYLAAHPQWWDVPARVAPALEQERARRKKVPIYREPILDWLSRPDIGHKSTLTMKEVMEGALNVTDLEKWPRLQQPVGEALRDLGWHQEFEWVAEEYKNRRIWVRDE